MASLIETHYLIGHLKAQQSSLHANLHLRKGKLVGIIAKNAHDALDYSGEYEATSKISEDQTLETAKRYLSRNIIIRAIPYAEVSNLSGGKTVTIGG